MRSHNLVPIILLWLLLVAVLPLHVRAYDALDDILSSSTSNLVHMFWVDPTKHDSYGLTYPVTYEFSIPDGSSGLKAYKRFGLLENWVQIVEKTSDDLFNGVEAVRFDYANSRVYVSVAFGADSDFVYLCFKDSSGSEVVSSFIDITNYYDNREVAVTFTIDDIGIRAPFGGNENFTKASIAFADAKVWWTAGWKTESRISVELIEEGILQEGINRGYLEIAAHSRTHPSTPYDDYDSEIGGCKDDIISNLDLPYKKGSQEYVWCWIEPAGLSDDMVQQKLGEYNYLVSRDDIQIHGPTYYEEWNSEYGLYDRAMTTIYMDSHSLTEINDAFDVAYNVGGIYHPWGHVGKIGWDSGMKGHEHIQYVSGKKDAWYVGFGHLYAYRYASQIVQSDQVPVADFSASPTSGSEPLTVAFTDLSTSYDGIISWLWDFGDGTTSTDQNPTRVYDEGAYTVSLTVWESDGDADTETKFGYITVTVQGVEEIFGEGFESNDFSAWTSTRGSPQVVGSPAHCGSYAMQSEIDGEWVRKRLSTDPNVSYHRLYVYFTDLPDSNGEDIRFMRTRHYPSGAYIVTVGIIYRGSSSTVNWYISTLEASSDIVSYYTPSTAIQTGQWYCVEVMCDMSSSDGTADGNYGLWIDGSSIVQRHSKDTDYTSVGNLRVGSINNDESVAVYVDCVVVAETYIGC